MSQNANPSSPALKPSDWIRVSCAVLCRIKHLDRYLLLLNANRRQKGLYILSPVGGALAVDNPTIFQRWSAIPESPDGRDLRCLMPLVRLDEFRQWFIAGVERERSPFRELHEELVTESRLLTALEPDDVRFDFVRMREEEQLTQRSGQTGLLTHYFQEIYDITFTSWRVMGALLAAPLDSGALWVDEAQVRTGAALRMEIDQEERDVLVRASVLLGG